MGGGADLDVGRKRGEVQNDTLFTGYLDSMQIQSLGIPHLCGSLCLLLAIHSQLVLFVLVQLLKFRNWQKRRYMHQGRRTLGRRHKAQKENDLGKSL